MDRDFLAVIDGTCGGATRSSKVDRSSIYVELRRLSHKQDKILFVADGASRLERSRGIAAAVGGQPGTGRRVVDSIMRWSISARSRAAGAAGGSGASGVDRSPAASPAERRSRGGANGDRCRSAFSARQGVETQAQILQSERRKVGWDRARIAALKLPIGMVDREWIRRVVDCG